MERIEFQKHFFRWDYVYPRVLILLPKIYKGLTWLFSNSHRDSVSLKRLFKSNFGEEEKNTTAFI